MDLNTRVVFVPFPRELTDLELDYLEDGEGAVGSGGVDVIILKDGVVLPIDASEDRKQRYIQLANEAIELVAGLDLNEDSDD